VSDRDDANNLTIGPRDARSSKATTRVFKAIDETKLRRAARAEGVSPTTLFWLGVVRNFVLGIPFTGIGFVWAYKVHGGFVKAGTPIRLADLPAYIPAGVFLLIGVAFLAPGQTEAALRFIGLGGILDRLPFLKAKEPVA
jgi:hypothetical protein